MAKTNELTVDVTAKLTVSDEAAKRCMALLEMWMDDNPDRNIVCELVAHNGVTHRRLRIGAAQTGGSIMDKFIPLEEAEQAICEVCERPGCPKLWGHCCNRIDRLNAIPAADVRPVVRGEWLPAKDGYYGHVMCSACHKIESHETDFCPNCGADMRKPRLRRCGLCENEHVRLEQLPNGFWHVVCDRYACDRKVEHYYDNPDEAVYQWNTKNYILE